MAYKGFNLDYSDTAQKTQQNLDALTQEGKVLGSFYGETTSDVASIADGDEAAVEVTVTGVALGDMVVGVSASVDVADLVLNANVTAANTVTVVLANNTGGAVNLASATYRVLVWDLT